jgi:hypothetical protein
MSSRRGAVTLEGRGFCFLGVVEMLQLILKVASVDRGLGLVFLTVEKQLLTGLELESSVNLSN